MQRKSQIASFLALGLCLLASCGPQPTMPPTVAPPPTMAPTAAPIPSPTPAQTAPPPTTLPAAPTMPAYPPLPTVPTPVPSSTPTPTPLPAPLPALSLLEAAPAADWDMEEVVLLGISQTERLALQARLRSGETLLAPVRPDIVPAGVSYRAKWIAPYLILQPTGQPTDVLSAPLMVLDLEGQVLYRIAVPSGYWVGPFVLSPDGRQLAYDQDWVTGWAGTEGHTRTGPYWEVRVWDLPAGRVQIVWNSDTADMSCPPYYQDPWPHPTRAPGECVANGPYSAAYWSPGTGQLYLQGFIPESDAPPQELVSRLPGESGWQIFTAVRGYRSFSPDGLAAAYLVYSETLAAGRTYYDEGLTLRYNQLWIVNLQTGESRLLLQADDGAQYGQFAWTTDGLLLLRYRAADHATVQEWELLRVDPDTGAASPVLRQEGPLTAPPGGWFSPRWERWLTYNSMDYQFTVHDLVTGQQQDVTPLVSGLYNFLWCEGGTALVEQWGGHVSRIDLRTMTVEALTGWTEVARCR